MNSLDTGKSILEIEKSNKLNIERNYYPVIAKNTVTAQQC